MFTHPIFGALRRNLFAIVLLLLVGNLFIHLAEFWPQVWGELGAPLLRGFGLVSIAVGVSKMMYAIIDPNAKTQVLYDQVTHERNVAAGLALIARAIIVGVIIMVTCTASRANTVSQLTPVTHPTYQNPIASTIPAPCLPFMKDLRLEEDTYWADMPIRSYLAAQIEQETGPCTNKAKASCCNAKAELKTAREHGVGLPQLTIAYTALGAVRFDALTELVNRHPRDLKGLSWAHWQDPQLQLRAIVLKNRDTCRKIVGAKTPEDATAFCASAYNGGATGLSNDRLSCRAVPGCDASRWFGNVENTSLKSKTVIPGYGGQSPFSINRTYVHNVVKLFMPKYRALNT